MTTPKFDLTTFFLSVSTAAFMGLGFKPDGKASDEGVDFELAKQNIDLLELLQEKTKGNRTEDEDRLLTHLLFETRMRYVETQKRLQKKD